MNEIFYILVLLSLLFLIEKKAINILITYVGLIITIAIILPLLDKYNIPYITPNTLLHLGSNINEYYFQYTTSLKEIEGEYYSYILILIQVSALTILFGFIIMLFPSLSHSQPTLSTEFRISTKNVEFRYKWIIIVGIIILGIIIFYHSTINLIPISNINPKNTLTNSNIDLVLESDFGGQEDNKLVRKLGRKLYENNNDIIKLLLITVVLLLAIIALFFLIPFTI